VIPALLALPCVLQAQPAATADLPWLAGRWTWEGGGRTQEEIWSLQGDQFAGLFRETREGRSVFFEIMALEPEEGGPVLRIRHFGPGLLRAWEEREAPKAFRLVRASASEAVFEGMGAAEGSRLHYRLTAPDALVITGEFLHGGKRVNEVFTLRRTRH